MAFRPERVTVDTDPTVLAQSSSPAGSDNPGSKVLAIITNVSPAQGSVFIGGDSVTDADGYEWSPEIQGRSLELELFPGSILYAVVSSGTQDFHVLIQEQ